jgi:hypothetical protein
MSTIYGKVFLIKAITNLAASGLVRITFGSLNNL